jgi:hypothetical protein
MADRDPVGPFHRWPNVTAIILLAGGAAIVALLVLVLSPG